jgi:hypothetical protein
MRARTIARTLRVAILGAAVLGLGYIVIGPLRSGAWFLLLPTFTRSRPHDLPAGYVAFHKGSVDFATGLYVRHDEDLIVRGTPPLIVHRAYLSRYRVSKQFGIGATHEGEWYLIGDPKVLRSWTGRHLLDGRATRR